MEASAAGFHLPDSSLDLYGPLDGHVTDDDLVRFDLGNAVMLRGPGNDDVEVVMLQSGKVSLFHGLFLLSLWWFRSTSLWPMSPIHLRIRLTSFLKPLK